MNFGDVDKVESAAKFSKIPLVVYLEELDTLEAHRHDDDGRGDIDLIFARLKTKFFHPQAMSYNEMVKVFFSIFQPKFKVFSSSLSLATQR